jgi:hypothetical protein
VDGWFNQSILSPSSSTTTHGFVAVEIVGEGIATMDPDLESYPLGTPVLVRAIPEATWKFTGWSGVASPLSNPISLVVTGAHHFTALFTPINNTPPTISGLADLVVSEDDRGRTIPFTIGDAHSQASRLAVAATSSNSSLIPNSKILLGGIGQERTITLSPAANASGTATIKVTVGDGDLITTNTFVIQVAPVNDLPTITRIPDQSILGEGSTPPIPFIIGDLESSAASLIVSAISSNPQLVPNSGIVFGGSGSNRTVRITPKSSSSGGTTITVKVSDGRDSVATAFLVEVLEPGAIPLSGLALWLRADALQLLDGGEVAQWNDQSGNNRHATQTFAPGRPTMVNNAVNGKPAVRLDGIDDYLTFNLPVNGLTGLSVFLVAANTEIQSGGASGAERAALFWNENASWGTIYLSPYQSSVQLRFGTTQSENRVSYSRPNSVGSSFTLTSAIKNGGTDSLYVNGNLAVSSNGKFNTIAGCQSTGNIGRGYNDNTYFAGYVAELLVYTRALSPVEREAVETQLNDKYLLIGPRPRLDLARTGNLLRLSWPSDAPDYVLEIKEGFLSEWREADEVPVVENGENVVMTNVAQPIRFYRLRRR